MSEADGPHALLRPFETRLPSRPGGPQLHVVVRIDQRGCTLQVDGTEQSLRATVVPTAQGALVRLASQQHELSAGLTLRVRVEPSEPATLQLELSARSPAMDRARPLFGRLGGDADLARLIAPPRWALSLCFDALGVLQPQSAAAERLH